MSNRHLKLRHVIRAARAHKIARGDDGLRQRLAEIRGMPSKRWNGHKVYLKWCDGDFGKAPHELWVPSNLLLSLLSVNFYLCAWHR